MKGSNVRYVAILAMLAMLVAGCGPAAVEPANPAQSPSAARLTGSPAPIQPSPTATKARDKVTVQLDWVLRGEHSIFFIGVDQGYFADQGIDVIAIRPGTGSSNTMRIVGANGAEFGFGDLPTLAVAQSKDVPVVALAAVGQRSPIGMITIGSKHSLRAPKDLQGLTIGISPAGSTYIFYQALTAANNVDRKTITEKTVAPPFEQYLLQGKVDSIPGYINAEVIELEAQAGGPGSLHILLGADYGYTAFGSGLLTSQSLISKNPDLVRRFTAAYMKAFQFMLKSPEQSADILVKTNAELAGKRDVLIKQIQAGIPLATNAATKANGLGYMDKSQWEKTLGILVEQKVIDKAPSVDSLFNNSFAQQAR